MKNKTATPAIPQLAASPFAPAELLDKDDLSATDRDFLGRQEKVIEAGQKTFIEVGTALREIHDYENGRLYKRYGTFEAYCSVRWEFGRTYAWRLMEAVGIYEKMFPRGNNPEGVTMPTTEKQMRVLGRLPSPKLQKEAWNSTVEAAGENPIRTRDVEKEVRAVIKREGIEPPASAKKRTAKPKFYQISAGAVAKVRTNLEQLRKAISKLKDRSRMESLIDRIEELLLDNGGK